MKSIKTTSDTKAFFLFAFLSLLTCGLQSVSTSPFFRFIGSDSGMFLTVGRVMVEGGVPYADAFDHKGPVIFLLNALALFVWDNLTSVWILEILCFLLTLVLLFKTGKRIMKEEGIILPLLYVLFMIPTIEGGNLTESYAAPLSAMALYILVRVQEKEEGAVKSLYGFGLGAAFAVILLTRANNAACVAGVTGALTISLLIKRQWAELLKNVIAFLLGAAAVTLPICFYFYSRGAFAAFIHGTFTFNFSYSQHEYVNGSSLPSVMKAVVFYGMLAACVFTALWNTIKCRRALTLSMLLVTILTVAAAGVSGRLYMHYVMLAAPVFGVNGGIMLSFVNGKLLFSKKSALGLAKGGILLFAVLYLVVSLPFTLRNIGMRGEEQEYRRQAIALAENIPKEQRDRVLLYSAGDSKWYLINDILPCYKYFTWQDWHSSSDSRIGEEFTKMLIKEPPLWLGVSINGIKEENKILIEKQYVEADRNEYHILYRLYE